MTKINIQVITEDELDNHDLIGCCLICGEDFNENSTWDSKFVCPCDSCKVEYEIEFINV